MVPHPSIKRYDHTPRFRHPIGHRVTRRADIRAAEALGDGRVYAPGEMHVLGREYLVGRLWMPDRRGKRDRKRPAGVLRANAVRRMSVALRTTFLFC